MKQPINWTVLVRIVIKTGSLFVTLNILWAVVQPMQWLDKVSVYNRLVPGRLRFGYGVQTDPKAVSAILLDEMFADHELSGSLSENMATEYRIGIFGASGIWGYGLNTDQMISAYINKGNWTLPDGRRIRAFNLALPGQSIPKDLLIMQRAIHYKLDAVYWFIDSISMLRPRQIISSPIVSTNPADFYNLLNHYPIDLPDAEKPTRSPNFLDQTIIGQRAQIATWLQDQLFGITWLQSLQDFTPFVNVHIYQGVTHFFSTGDVSWAGKSYNQSNFDKNIFMWDALEAGNQMAHDNHTELTIIVGPMWGASLTDANISYYPRWFLTDFLTWFNEEKQVYHWTTLDWRDAVPNSMFTDTAFHFTAEGSQIVANRLVNSLLLPSQTF